MIMNRTMKNSTTRNSMLKNSTIKNRIHCDEQYDDASMMKNSLMMYCTVR